MASRVLSLLKRQTSQVAAGVARWTRPGSNNVSNYGVGDGPAANLLRIIRDSPTANDGVTGAPDVKELYETATELNVKVNSRRHMKSLLKWMKKIGRVQTAPPPLGPSGAWQRNKNFSFSLTAKGAEHIARIDRAMGIDGAGSVGKPEQH